MASISLVPVPVKSDAAEITILLPSDKPQYIPLMQNRQITISHTVKSGLLHSIWPLGTHALSCHANNGFAMMPGAATTLAPLIHSRNVAQLARK
jgi:hypothetical protein